MRALLDVLKPHFDTLDGEFGLAAMASPFERPWVYQNRRFLAASTIKIPILLCYLENKHRLGSTHCIYAPEMFIEDSPCFEKCVPGQEIDWDTVAAWMMQLSDNTATNLMVDLLGLSTIQNWLVKERFYKTEINRKMMDLKAREAGVDNWTEPVDMLRMMARLLQGSYADLSSEGHKQALLVLESCKDREKIPFYFQSPIKVGNKPGELTQNRSDVGYILLEEKRLCLSVFCDKLVNDEAADLWIAELAQLIWNNTDKI